MNNRKDYLRPEDYAEPRCLLGEEHYGSAPEVISIPQQRIVAKLEEHMSRRDCAGAERHLLYWLEEARLGHDLRGELFLCNELIGHYRKNQERENALRFIDRALELLSLLQLENTLTAGTTLINAATACSAFDEEERALGLFSRARTIYESLRDVSAQKLGGLYNNMGVALTALGRYTEAYVLYDLAMERMAQTRDGALEQAITCLNRADTVAAERGTEAGEQEITALLDRAWELLQTEALPRDGYYAFVCEKCAPGFSYYGYFAAAAELKETAERIYHERS